MEERKIVAIATTEKVFLFNSIGIEALIIEEKNLEKNIEKLILDGLEIFLVSENLDSKLLDLREKYADKAYPVFLLLPIDFPASGKGTKKIEKDVEMAIGINIFKGV